MDNERDEELTVPTEFLRDSEFMPALWYAQKCPCANGLNPDDSLKDKRYLEEMEGVQAGAVQILLEKYKWIEGEESPPSDRFEVRPEGEYLVISDRIIAACFTLARINLSDPTFDLTRCYEQSVLDLDLGSSTYDLLEVQS
jgi:hypothetical protein